MHKEQERSVLKTDVAETTKSLPLRGGSWSSQPHRTRAEDVHSHKHTRTHRHSPQYTCAEEIASSRTLYLLLFVSQRGPPPVAAPLRAPAVFVPWELLTP